MTMPLQSPPASSGAAPSRVATFLDLIKFAHSVFALPFALIATFWASRVIGESWPGFGRLLLILAAMVVARTWAMTVNRLVDRKFDAANPRTARRPSVTGAISVPFMRSTLVLCVVLFLAVTSGFYFLYGNPWPLIFSLPVLAWLGAYSFTKRFTCLCHFWLGLSLGLAPVSAWLAIAPPRVDLLGAQSVTIFLLGAGVMFWVAGFDILYALQDEDFDRGEKLNSIPARVGRTKAIWISRACHVLTIALFAAVGTTGNFHMLYWIGFSAAVILLIVEQAIVSPTDISKINIAFMTANGLIGLIFGAMAIADVLLN